MLTILELTEKPCFLCGSKDKTVIATFAGRSFKRALCVAFIYDKLKVEVKNGPPAKSG